MARIHSKSTRAARPQTTTFVELGSWHRRAGRHSLPWRVNQSPYAVLVSEFMLQQTQVPRVIERFEAWLRRFPTLNSLAAAPEHDVLTAWEGLGYYRRARNLHRLSQYLTDQYGSDSDVDSALARLTVRELRELPGIGPYTAGALAAFAFKKPEVAIDTNVRRVVARLLGLAARNVASPKPCEFDARVEAWIRASFATLNPRVVHEALMDLGSAICTSKSPRCTECPLAARCLAPTAKSDDVNPTDRGGRKPTTHAIGMLRDGKTLLVPKRWKPPIVDRRGLPGSKRLGDPRHLLKEWYLQNYGVKVAVRPPMGIISADAGPISVHRVALIHSTSAHFHRATPAQILKIDPLSVRAFETLRLITEPG